MMIDKLKQFKSIMLVLCVLIGLLIYFFITLHSNEDKVESFHIQHDILYELKFKDKNIDFCFNESSKPIVFDELYNDLNTFLTSLNTITEVADKVNMDQNYIDALNSLKNNFIKKKSYIEEFKTLQDINKKEKIYVSIKDIDLKKEIKNIHELLAMQVHKKKIFHQRLIYSLFMAIFILLVMLIWVYKRLNDKHKGLIAFKTAVEDSYNTVVMTDKNRKIVFVNEMFEKITGYKKEEVLGNNPNVLKSGCQNDEFYKKLNDTINNGKKWYGRFINKKKNGELFYEDATITPVFVNNEITGYLAIKVDVTQNVKNAQQLEKLNRTLEERVQEELINNLEKERRLFESAKMASMGEMIGNIAHQWRQPLNTVSAIASSIKLDCSFNDLEVQKVDADMDAVLKQIQYLSQTIDTFRDFIKAKKDLHSVVVQDVIESALHIVSAMLESKNIEIRKNFNKENVIEITTIPQELSQVIINIINNAKDILIEKDIKKKYIEIDSKQKGNRVLITIEDNAGGIADNVMPHIFEPYFTTKHKSNGTGLGLHMSYKIIVGSLKGKIYAKNTKNGAKFYIELPLKLVQNKG